MSREAKLSEPAAFTAPRAVSDTELRMLLAVANVLIPAAGDDPAATSEPGYEDALRVALDARADAFDIITATLADLEGPRWGELPAALRRLHDEEPETFQPLSAVVAGAWLMLPEVRTRLRYPGQRRDPASVEIAVDEISSGILDPVVERGSIFRVAPE